MYVNKNQRNIPQYKLESYFTEQSASQDEGWINIKSPKILNDWSNFLSLLRTHETFLQGYKI